MWGNYLSKVIFVSVLLILLIFSGCLNNTDNSERILGSGDSGVHGIPFVAVDPYITGARFFQDTDDDRVYDAGEPLSTYSDENGVFYFTGTIESDKKVIILPEMKARHLGKVYTTIIHTLPAYMYEGKVFVSPLTTVLTGPFNTADLIQLFSDGGFTGVVESDLKNDPFAPVRSIDTSYPVNNDVFTRSALSISVNTYLDLIRQGTSEVSSDEFFNEENSWIFRDICAVVRNILNSDNMQRLDNIINAGIPTDNETVMANPAIFSMKAIDMIHACSDTLNFYREELKKNSDTHSDLLRSVSDRLTCRYFLRRISNIYSENDNIIEAIQSIRISTDDETGIDIQDSENYPYFISPGGAISGVTESKIQYRRLSVQDQNVVIEYFMPDHGTEEVFLSYRTDEASFVPVESVEHGMHVGMGKIIWDTGSYIERNIETDIKLIIKEHGVVIHEEVFNDISIRNDANSIPVIESAEIIGDSGTVEIRFSYSDLDDDMCRAYIYWDSGIWDTMEIQSKRYVFQPGQNSLFWDSNATGDDNITEGRMKLVLSDGFDRSEPYIIEDITLNNNIAPEVRLTGGENTASGDHFLSFIPYDEDGENVDVSFFMDAGSGFLPVEVEGAHTALHSGDTYTVVLKTSDYVREVKDVNMRMECEDDDGAGTPEEFVLSVSNLDSYEVFSTTDNVHNNIKVCAEGSRIHIAFVKNNLFQSYDDIYYSMYSDGIWSEPEVVGKISPNTDDDGYSSYDIDITAEDSYAVICAYHSNELYLFHNKYSHWQGFPAGGINNFEWYGRACSINTQNGRQRIAFCYEYYKDTEETQTGNKLISSEYNILSRTIIGDGYEDIYEPGPGEIIRSSEISRNGSNEPILTFGIGGTSDSTSLSVYQKNLNYINAEPASVISGVRYFNTSNDMTGKHLLTVTGSDNSTTVFDRDAPAGIDPGLDQSNHSIILSDRLNREFAAYSDSAAGSVRYLYNGICGEMIVDSGNDSEKVAAVSSDNGDIHIIYVIEVGGEYKVRSLVVR